MKLTRHDKPIVQQRDKRLLPNPNSIAQRARQAGLSPYTVYDRLKRMPLEEALTTPPMPQKESASLAGKASRQSARARKAVRATEASS